MLSNYKRKCIDDELRFFKFGMDTKNTDSFYNSAAETHLNCGPVVEKHFTSGTDHNQNFPVFLPIL
jgi:hypothetical protein